MRRALAAEKIWDVLRGRAITEEVRPKVTALSLVLLAFHSVGSAAPEISQPAKILLEQLLFHSSAPLPNELALRFTAGASTGHRRCGDVRDPEMTAALLQDVAEKLLARGGYVLARRMDDLECPACASLSFVRLLCAAGEGEVVARDAYPSPPAPPSEGQCSVSLSLDLPHSLPLSLPPREDPRALSVPK